MKKLISIFLLVAMLISVIPCVALSVAAEGETITPDTSWWDSKTEGQTEFILEDEADLLGFAKLVADTTANNEFKDCIVYLKRDMDINPGWSAESYKTVADKPTNVWPAMTTGVDFAGTFDGQIGRAHV